MKILTGLFVCGRSGKTEVSKVRPGSDLGIRIINFRKQQNVEIFCSILINI